MGNHHRVTRQFQALCALAALATPLAAAAQTVDDSFLISTSVSPNVVLFLDQSNSMNQIEWHPAYDPSATPSCTHWDNSLTYTTKNGMGALSLGNNETACGYTRTIYRSTGAGSPPTLWDGRYLNWYFSLPDGSPVLTQIQTATVTPAGCNGAGSSTRFIQQFRRTRAEAAKQVFLDVLCLAEPRNVRFSLAEFRAAADVGGVDPNGAFISVPLDNPSPAHATDTEAHVGNATEDPATPLAEGMFQIYTYLMPRTVADMPFGNDGVTKFPRYTYDKQGAYNAGAQMLADPVQFACQKNFVILVTTGLGTRDDFDSDPASTAQGFSSFSNLIGDYYAENLPPTPNPDVEVPGTANESTLYLDDVVKYMQDKDLRPDFDDDQTVDVYTIGYGTTPADDAYLRRVSEGVGNGLHFHAQDGSALAASLLSALNDIIEKSRSFTAATVPSARTADGGDFYNSFFLPSSKSPFWEGHLRSWHFTAAGEVVDSNGDCALDDPDGGSECNNGPFKNVCEPGQTTECVVPFWDAGSTLTSNFVPGAANSDTNARQLFTSKLNTATPPVPVRTNLDFGLTAADMKIATFTAPAPVPYTAPPSPAPNSLEYTVKRSQALNAEGLADEVIAYARGCFFGTGVFGSPGPGDNVAPSPDGNKPCEKRPWLLGDIFHSDPIVVRNPPDRNFGSTYDTFRAAYIDRNRVIYTGTNGGYLEGFDAGTWSTSLLKYDEGTGAEKFGFMPWESRTKIKNQPIDDPVGRTIYVDGAPQVADTWLYSNATSATKAAADWRTMLVGGLREGGRHYYALDVTNPSNDSGGPAGNLPYPGLKWEWPNEDDYNKSVAGTGCGSTYPCDYANMGQTWGQAVITRVKLNVGASTNGGAGFERWVAIVTGGYDATSDPNPAAVDPTTTTYSAASTKGRAIYVLDLKTGKVIAEQKMGGSAPNSSMKYSLVSTPAVLDIDFDGFADIVYVGDLRGQVWKWVIHPVGEDRVNDASGLRTQPNWKFQLFFQSPWSQVASGSLVSKPAWIAPSGTAYYRNIYQPPAAAFVNSQLWITFGTGERHAIGFKGYGSSDSPADSGTVENNRYYVINDPDPLATAATAPPIVTEPPPSPTTCASGYVCTINNITSSGSPGTRGYYFTTLNGEKFVTTSVIFGGKVISASFTPSQLKLGDPGFDPCTQRGSGKLYEFDLLSGVGEFRDASNNPTRFTSLGTGMPTDPKISIGADDTKVVIQKSGTDIEIMNGPPPDEGRGIIYWREMH